MPHQIFWSVGLLTSECPVVINGLITRSGVVDNDCEAQALVCLPPCDPWNASPCHSLSESDLRATEITESISTDSVVICMLRLEMIKAMLHWCVVYLIM